MLTEKMLVPDRPACYKSHPSTIERNYNCCLFHVWDKSLQAYAGQKVGSYNARQREEICFGKADLVALCLRGLWKSLGQGLGL